MRPAGSIRLRLLLGGAVLLLAFLAGAGVAVQRAHEDSVRAAQFARLQSTVYLLLAGAELDGQGRLRMPAALAEPRLGLPGSGLYAAIHLPEGGPGWQSASTLGLADPPFRRDGGVGQWRFEELEPGYLAASYAVRWATGAEAAPLVLSVLEDRAGLERELAVFSRTLWSWLGGAAALLLLAQLLLLRWALAPLRQVAHEIRRIESGRQERLEARYPVELARLTDNLNALIREERVRQTRYQEALSYLAHSLKTPLAVLRGALAEPQKLPEAVDQQVRRMDDIVQHQLARAMAGGARRLTAPLLLAPPLERTRDALAKVHADKGLRFHIDCPPQLAWRIDEGDWFEIAGNLMDNAAKWARHQVRVQLASEGGQLRLRVEDDGPGFGDTESVLQLHVRADERVPGHGVGLAVVNDLVSTAGGQLALGRSALGGAKVEILLP